MISTIQAISRNAIENSKHLIQTLSPLAKNQIQQLAELEFRRRSGDRLMISEEELNLIENEATQNILELIEKEIIDNQ